MTSPGQCIAVASGKGGTGKTSFTAGVGAALALSGRRVLCLDCDIGLRNLDLALGLSDRTLMTSQTWRRTAVPWNWPLWNTPRSPAFSC